VPFLILWAVALTSAARPERVLALGRVVNLATMMAEGTLTERSPEQELSDPSGDFAVARLDDGRIQAYRLSTRETLWSLPSRPPCESIALGRDVFAVCSGNLLALARADGHVRTLARGTEVRQVLVMGDLLASVNDRGVVVVFDGRGRSTRRSLLAGALGGGTLVPTETGGLCGYGVWKERRLTAGCWDRRLSPRWTRTLPVKPDPGAPSFEEQIPQVGPYHLVLPDRLVSWRDGSVTREVAPATVEDASGRRLPAATVNEALTRPLPAAPGQERLEGYPHANTAADGARAFVLSANCEGKLAAFDRATARILFSVPVSLGMLRDSLEVWEGYPVVLTKFAEGGMRQRLTIHDPLTGAPRYQDERPSR
jgi:hypothetical protein